MVKKKKKRTISPEQQAKMQEGRRRSKQARERLKLVEELTPPEPLTYTQRKLREIERLRKR